jgi:hypothetical protein
MQVQGSEMPGGISVFRRNILLAIVELGHWQAIEGAKFIYQ